MRFSKEMQRYRFSSLSSSAVPPPSSSSVPADVPTLHEVILAEKMDFEAKMVRSARRWVTLMAMATWMQCLVLSGDAAY